MANILFIVGLPGSGKTTLANRINKENGGKYRIIDDPRNFNSDVLPYLGEDLIITDPHLCFESNRKAAIERILSINPDTKIDWIFFENDPEACLKNVKGRDERRVETFIKNFNISYTIPPRATTVAVYQG